MKDLEYDVPGSQPESAIDMKDDHNENDDERHRRDRDYTVKGSKSFSSRRYWSRVILIAVLIFILVLNFVAISMAIRSIYAYRKRAEHSQQTRGRKREVVAPLCLPCEQVGMTAGRRDVAGKEGERGEEVEDEDAGGWRRYKDGDQDMCCPLHHRNLASAVGQIYDKVLQEQQQDFSNQPRPAFAFHPFYSVPDTTEEVVAFTNQNKPLAHVTGVQAYDVSKYPVAGCNGSSDKCLCTVFDWPLRTEPYRSTTRGSVRRLTWGLVVPVSGLYRMHSMVNLYFPYPQNTKRHWQEKQSKPVEIVHQLTRYKRAEGQKTMLAERNTTISTSYTDGLTSFLVTVENLQVGDVISLSLSYRAAQALRDRWHSQGLFLVQ